MVTTPTAAGRVHYSLARALSWWGWRDGAATAFRDALRSDPAFADAHFRLGETLARQGRWREAGAAFAEATRLLPSSVEAQGNLVLALGLVEDWAAAAEALRRLTDLRPRRAELHLLMGVILRRVGRPWEAIRSFRWALRLEAPAGAERFFLGEGLLGPEEWRHLQSAFRAARLMAPHDSHSRYGRSSLNVHPGAPFVVLSPRRRRRVLERLRLHGARGGAAVILAALASVAHAETREARDKARECFVVAREPGIAPCREALRLGLPPARESLVEAALGAKLAALDRWDEVVDVYREGARRRPMDPVAQLRLGMALLHVSADATAAERALRDAARLRPTEPEAHLQLGLALGQLGRTADAVGAFEEALRLEPSILDQRPAARAALEAARRGEAWPPS